MHRVSGGGCGTRLYYQQLIDRFSYSCVSLMRVGMVSHSLIYSMQFEFFLDRFSHSCALVNQRLPLLVSDRHLYRHSFVQSGIVNSTYDAYRNWNVSELIWLHPF